LRPGSERPAGELGPDVGAHRLRVSTECRRNVNPAREPARDAATLSAKVHVAVHAVHAPVATPQISLYSTQQPIKKRLKQRSTRERQMVCIKIVGL
jgi:hypothetical protein